MNQNNHNTPRTLRKLTIAIALALPAFSPPLSALAAGTAPQNTANPQSKTLNFNIPAQPLANALNAFIAVSDWQVGFPAGMAKNIRASAVKGNYTPQQALQHLLAGSGLGYRLTGTNTVTLEKAAVTSPQSNVTTLPALNVVADAEYEDTDPYNPTYVQPDATTGTKTDTPIMLTPLNVQVITKQVLKDQQVITLADSLKNVSGVTLQQYSGGAGTGGTDQIIVLRGFASDTYFRNGFRIQSGGGGAQREMANVESVEVLKGSGAILYGLVEPGGMVNVITKQPLATPYYALQQQFGSYSLYRTTLDATGPLTKDDTLLYRMNFSYEDSGSFREFVQNQKLFVAPVLKWNISPRTQVTAEFEYNHDNLGLDAQFVPTYNGQFINIPRSLNYGEPATGKVDTYFGSLSGSHQFNDDWSVKSSFRANTTTLYRTSIIPLSPPITQLIFGTPADQIGQYLARYDHQRDNYSGNIDLIGHFATWGLKHTLLLGGDYYRDNYYYLDNSTSADVALINVLNPVHSGLPNAGLVIDPTTKYSLDENTDQYGLYLQDQIDLPYHLYFTGGFRYQNLHQKSVNRDYLGNPTWSAPLTADAVTPRVGLLWRPQNWLSLYSNYAENFGANFGTTADNKPLPPTGAQQWEVGAKTEFFDGRLRATLAYYDLTKQNVATNDPVHIGSSLVTGEVRSRGPELDIQGEILPGWNVIATYANTYIIVTKGSSDPNNYPAQGSRYYGVPRNTASLWNTFEFQQEELRGLKIGGGVTVRDGQLATTNANMANPFTIPGYATVDLMTAYSFKLGKSKLTAQLNVNNLLDKYYYTSAYFMGPPQAIGYDGGYVNFGAPRTLMGSIRVDY